MKALRIGINCLRPTWKSSDGMDTKSLFETGVRFNEEEHTVLILRETKEGLWVKFVEAQLLGHGRGPTTKKYIYFLAYHKPLEHWQQKQDECAIYNWFCKDTHTTSETELEEMLQKKKNSILSLICLQPCNHGTWRPIFQGNCQICYEEVTTLLALIPCGHIICFTCLKQIVKCTIEKNVPLQLEEKFKFSKSVDELINLITQEFERQQDLMRDWKRKAETKEDIGMRRLQISMEKPTCDFFIWVKKGIKLKEIIIKELGLNCAYWHPNEDTDQQDPWIFAYTLSEVIENFVVSYLLKA